MKRGRRHSFLAPARVNHHCFGRRAENPICEPFLAMKQHARRPEASSGAANG